MFTIDSFVIRSRDGKEVNVDNSNRLFVTASIATPTGKTPISNVQKNDISGTSDSFTVIPSGFTVTIQRLKGGSQEDVNGGSVIELYYAPSGNTTGIVLIDAIYVNGGSIQYDEDYLTPVGDGTKAILLRRRRLAGGSVEVFGRWEGFY